MIYYYWIHIRIHTGCKIIVRKQYIFKQVLQFTAIKYQINIVASVFTSIHKYSEKRRSWMSIVNVGKQKYVLSLLL